MSKYNLMLLLLLLGCENNSNRGKIGLKKTDTANFRNFQLFDNSAIDINKFDRNIQLDSSHCGLNKFKRIISWEDKIGQIFKMPGGYAVKTDSLFLVFCNLKYIHLNSDSLVLFSGSSFQNENEGFTIGYLTILTSLRVRTYEN